MSDLPMQISDAITGVVRSIAEQMVDELRRHLREQTIKPRILTVEEAGVYLGRTPGAIRNMYASGKIAAVKLDDRVCFDIQDLDKLIQESKGFLKNNS